MRRAAALGAIAALVALATPGTPARAQSSGFGLSSGLFGVTEGEVRKASSSPVRVTGDVRLTWSADPATCAPVGRCGWSGVASLRLTREHALTLLDTRTRSGRAVVPLLFPSAFENGDRAFALVRRPRTSGGPGLCTDGQDRVAALEARVARGAVVLGFGSESGNPFGSRCGGPAFADLRFSLPEGRLPLRDVRRRGGRVDLRREARFAGGGLVGTVESTLVAWIGRPTPERLDDDGEEREDAVRTARWRITRVTGALRAQTRGVGPEERCTLLDACSLTSLATITPRPRDGELLVYRPPIGDRGMSGQLYGAGGWERDAGTIETAVTRSDAPATCTDTAQLAGGLLLITTRPDGRLEALYEPQGTITRCPGPELFDPEIGGRTASALVPAGALDGRRATLRLTRGSDRERAGFRVATTPDLTIEIERVGGGR